MSRFTLSALVFLTCVASLSAADTAALKDAYSYPIAKHDNFPILPVMIDGKRFPFLLATSSKGIFVDSRLRSNLGKPIATMQLETASGIQRVPTYRPPFKRIGGMPIGESLFAVCLPLDTARQVADLDFFGAVGFGVFQSKIVEFDFDAEKWRIIDKVPPNAGEAFDYGNRSVPSIPVRLPRVGMRWFAVNTVSNTSLAVSGALFQQLVKNGSIPIVRKTPHVVDEGSHAIGNYGRLKEISVGKNVNKLVGIIAGTRESVGTPYLSRFRVTIDFPNHIVYLKKGRNYGRADRWDLSGLHFKRIGKKAVVTAVEKGSVAEKAGIKPKDVIVRAGDKHGEKTHLSDLGKVFSKNGTVEIVIERGQKRVRHTLDLKKISQ